MFFTDLLTLDFTFLWFLSASVFHTQWGAKYALEIINFVCTLQMCSLFLLLWYAIVTDVRRQFIITFCVVYFILSCWRKTRTVSSLVCSFCQIIISSDKHQILISGYGRFQPRQNVLEMVTSNMLAFKTSNSYSMQTRLKQKTTG